MKHVPRIVRAKFNSDLDFVVVRPFEFRGTKLTSGPFDKTHCPFRLLRQLFDQRLIDTVPAGAPQASNRNYKPDFSAMGLKSLRSWLMARGVVPRFQANHRTLVEKAEAVFKSPQQGRAA